MRWAVVAAILRGATVEDTALLRRFPDSADAEQVGIATMVLARENQNVAADLDGDVSVNVREDARDRLRRAWATPAPEEAAAYVDSLGAAEAEVARAKRSLVEHWHSAASGEELRSQLLAWIDQQRGTENGPGVYAELTGPWASDDLQRVSEWATKSLRGPERDAAAAALSVKLAKVDAEAAYLWAESIEDAVLRADHLGQALEAWRRFRPETAPP